MNDVVPAEQQNIIQSTSNDITPIDRVDAPKEIIGEASPEEVRQIIYTIW